MTVADKIATLQNTINTQKANIKTAMAAKGVTLNDDYKLSDLPTAIGNIPQTGTGTGLVAGTKIPLNKLQAPAFDYQNLGDTYRFYGCYADVEENPNNAYFYTAYEYYGEQLKKINVADGSSINQENGNGSKWIRRCGNTMLNFGHTCDFETISTSDLSILTSTSLANLGLTFDNLNTSDSYIVASQKVGDDMYILAKIQDNDTENIVVKFTSSNQTYSLVKAFSAYINQEFKSMLYDDGAIYLYGINYLVKYTISTDTTIDVNVDSLTNGFGTTPYNGIYKYANGVFVFTNNEIITFDTNLNLLHRTYANTYYPSKIYVLSVSEKDGNTEICILAGDSNNTVLDCITITITSSGINCVTDNDIKIDSNDADAPYVIMNSDDGIRILTGKALYKITQDFNTEYSIAINVVNDYAVMQKYLYGCGYIGFGSIECDNKLYFVFDKANISGSNDHLYLASVNKNPVYTYLG